MSDDRVSELVIRGKNLSEQAFSEAARDLRGLQANAAAASRDMSGLGADGKKAFTDMRGAVTDLAGALGLAFSVQGLVSFGAELLRMGDEIQKTADRTGLTTEQVQRLQYVAEQSGNSLEDMTGAVSQLQNRLASGDASALSALKQLNLSFDDLATKNPYEQMQAIAGAFGEIPNPAQQAQIAMDLFGKSGATILPTLKADFLGLANAAPVMSDATVKALDTAGDELAKFKGWVKVAAAESYTYARGLFDGLLAWGMKVIASFADLTASLLEMAQKIPGASKVIPELAAKIKDAREQAAWYRETAAGMTRETEKQAAAAAKAVPPIVAHTGAVKAHGDAQRSTTKAVSEATEATAEQLAIQALIEKAKRNEAASVAWATTQWKAWEAAASKALTSIANNPSLPLLQGRNLSGIGALIQVPDSTRIEVPPAVKQGFFASMFGTSAEFGKALSTTVLAAVQGGGSPIAAAGSLIGSSLLGGLAKTITSGAGLAISGALGSALNVILPGIGSMLGPLLSKAWDGIKGLFGKGTAGRDLVKDFIAQNFGSASELQKQLLALGPQYDRLWRGLTQLGNNASTQEARAAIDAVTAALANQKKVVEDVTPSVADLVGIAQKYGGTLDDLGPKAQSLDITDKANQLVEDFKKVEAATGDLGGIYNITADEVNDLIKRAEETKTALPESLKPFMQEMANAGLLVDATGEKLTDLSGLTWQESLTTKVGDLVDVMKDFVDTIKNGAVPALTELGRTRISPIRVPYYYEEGGFSGRYDGLPPSSGPSSTSSGRGSTSRTGAVQVQLMLDKRVLTSVVARNLPGEVQRFGVGRR